MQIPQKNGSPPESGLWGKGRSPWYNPNTAGPVQPFIVCVAGGSASGKTTVCRSVVEKLDLQWVQILSTDSFYKGLTPEQHNNVSNYNFDHPSAFDWDLLFETLSKVRKGQLVHIPVYDFVTHSRTGETTLFYGADVVFLEGILVLFEERIRDMCDMLIFVDTDADIVRRDIASRGRSLESVLVQYEKTVKPSFDEFIAPTKRFADLIIPRGGGNEVAINLLVQHIRSQLSNRWEQFQQSYHQESDQQVAPTFMKILHYENIHVLPRDKSLDAIFTLLRDENTDRDTFVEAADRICDRLLYFALDLVPYEIENVETPTGSIFEGCGRPVPFCGVSIVRSGEPMEKSLRNHVEDVQIGKLVIQQADSKEIGPRLYYYRFPRIVRSPDTRVFLMDAILASANAIIMAIRVLLDHEVRQENIIVVCIAAAPEGLTMVSRVFPGVQIVTSAVEDHLDDHLFLVPGFGYFGERYYYTKGEFLE